MKSEEFELLLLACHEIADQFPDGLIFIGGIAVYLHAVNNQLSELADFTHDADFYISLADMGDLRDIEEVTPNRRLSKHQLIKRGFEFDIYTERQSSLIVPYAEIARESVSYERFRVASLGHLLALKLEAFRDRVNSSKGDKDAADIYRIAMVAKTTGFDAQLAAPYLGDEHMALLDRIRRGPFAVAMAHGNAHLAKSYRAAVEAMSDAVARTMKAGSQRKAKGVVAS